MYRTETNSPINEKTIGVLSESEVVLVGSSQGKRVLRSTLLPFDASTPGGLMAFLWQEGLTEAWVMPGTNLSRTATCAWFEQAGTHWMVITHPNPSELTRPHCVFIWPRGSSQRETRRLALVFPEQSGWNWVLPDARSLLATVTYLDQVLGRSVIDAPNLVAHQLLTDLTLGQPPSRLSSSPTEPGILSSIENITRTMMQENAHDRVWMRPLTLAEQRQRYLHKYTHLSRYLEACLTVRLGTGAAAYSPNGRAYDGSRAGLWRVHAELAGSVFDGKHLPHALHGAWSSTPQVKCCQDISYHVAVGEGYYWSQSQELLTPWAQTLWQAAERLHTHPQNYRHSQGRANAFQTIKQLAQRGVAILAEDESRGGWARPDWWTQVVGRSQAIFFSHLASLTRRGAMPVLVDQDALWIVADTPNPLAAIPGLISVQRWRGYMVGYEVPLPLSFEVKAAFRTAEHPGQVVEALDTLAGLPV